MLFRSVAGTTPRGDTEAEDESFARTLLADDKNLREHDFVVQNIKADILELCENYFIPDTPRILKSQFIQHLYTPVSGKLKMGYGIFDVVEKMHPTPALGGLPREAAMNFLREEERLERGWYGAPFGWVDAKGNGEFIVGIRSVLIDGQHLTLFAGCGIVRDSNADLEYQETALKLKPMLASVGEVIAHGK